MGGTRLIPGTLPKTTANELSPANQTAEDWVWECCQDQGLGFVRSQMGRMLFSGDDGKKRLGALSGGEAARLVFCRLAIARPNVLVLDEPTNHLDLESIEALVEALKSYPGTLLIVSHDRWFISQLATPHCPRSNPKKSSTFAARTRSTSTFVATTTSTRIKSSSRPDKRKEKKRHRPENRDLTAREKNKQRRTAAQQEKRLARIEKAEARLAEIDALRCEPTYYAKTPARSDQGPRMRTRGYRARVGDPHGGVGRRSEGKPWIKEDP